MSLWHVWRMAYQRNRPSPPPSGSRFVNVNPDGKGGGVWVDVNAPPPPVSTSMDLAMPPACLSCGLPPGSCEPVLGYPECKAGLRTRATLATRTRAHTRPAGTYR